LRPIALTRCTSAGSPSGSRSQVGTLAGAATGRDVETLHTLGVGGTAGFERLGVGTLRLEGVELGDELVVPGALRVVELAAVVRGRSSSRTAVCRSTIWSMFTGEVLSRRAAIWRRWKSSPALPGRVASSAELAGMRLRRTSTSSVNSSVVAGRSCSGQVFGTHRKDAGVVVLQHGLGRTE